MSAVVIQDAKEEIQVAAWVIDFDSFHRWTDSVEFPEHGRIDFLRGKVWVDMGEEQLFAHIKVKGEISYTLIGLVKAGLSGEFFIDGCRVTHPETVISAVPDGVYISDDTLLT